MREHRTHKSCVRVLTCSKNTQFMCSCSDVFPERVCVPERRTHVVFYVLSSLLTRGGSRSAVMLAVAMAMMVGARARGRPYHTIPYHTIWKGRKQIFFLGLVSGKMANLVLLSGKSPHLGLVLVSGKAADFPKPASSPSHMYAHAKHISNHDCGGGLF